LVETLTFCVDADLAGLQGHRYCGAFTKDWLAIHRHQPTLTVQV